MEVPAPSPRSGCRLWLATLALAAASCFALSLRPLHAQEAAAPRAQTQSPYFLVRSDDPALDPLPLKDTELDVRIAGVIAEVTVVQTYRNEGRRPIEARYVFPGSTRAAVGALELRIGDRLVQARIREKAQARIDYEAAKQEGRSAALLEQHLPNVFQMNVAGILPGDEVRVTLRYTELLVPLDGAYRFVYPTVVGPRYNSPASAHAGARWVAQPTLRAGAPQAAGFRLRVGLDMPLALRSVRSTSHAVTVAQPDGERRAEVTLAAGAGPAADRDFVLDYRLAGAGIQSGLLLHQGQGEGAENYFLAMIEPPASVAPQAVLPREYIFVVDISGSMRGFPLDTANAMLERLVGGLRLDDRFNVLLFSGSSRMLAPHPVPATRANIAQALATIREARGGGSTELIPALRRAYAEPKAEGVARTVVVVTDGYVTVEREAFELVRSNLGRANLFAFGIGSAVNRHLIEGLARAGMGEPFVITDPIQAPEQAARFRRLVEAPLLTQVRAHFEGLDVYDLEPAVLPDLLGERPLILFGKWRGPVRGSLVLEGRGAEGRYRQRIHVDPQAPREAPALRSLWARHRIASLSDQAALEGGDAQRRQITELGLRHALLTDYTSFVAVDRVVRPPAAGGGQGTDQPQPLPQGVAESAVGQVLGAEVPSTPEPETLGAIAVVLSMLAMLRRRARRCDRRRLTS